MAKEQSNGTEIETPATVGLNEADYEWDNVHEEAPDQLVFNVVGDKYIGTYEGHTLIFPDEVSEPSKWFIQLRWRDNDGLKVTNAGYELRTAYVDIDVADDGTITTKDKIPPGTVTRNELVKLVDVDQASPMKSFRVDTARR
jgi:hypothetical protein